MLEVFRKDHEDKMRAAEEKEHKRIKCEEKRKQREAEKEPSSYNRTKEGQA